MWTNKLKTMKALSVTFWIVYLLVAVFLQFIVGNFPFSFFSFPLNQTLEEAVRSMAKYEVGIELNDAETARLVAFLKTLTGEYKGKLLTNDNMK